MAGRMIVRIDPHEECMVGKPHAIFRPKPNSAEIPYAYRQWPLYPELARCEKMNRNAASLRQPEGQGAGNMVALVTMFAHDPEQERKTREFVHHHRAWFVLLGVALVVLGIIAAASSATTTFASMLFLSGVLLAGGVIRLISAFTARQWSGSLLLALSGALYVVSGVLTFRHPIAAALALTLLFAALFLGVGLFRVIAAIWYRFPNWGWVAVSGAVSVLLGLMLWNSWPVSGLWFIGLCIGIDLIVEGAGWIMLSLGVDGKGSETAPPIPHR
jgi:uncharacterized membrane protein HdeD (DUF308 family)